MAITTGHADDEANNGNDSTLTGSSHEYQSEIYLESALKAFVEAILRNIGDRDHEMSQLSPLRSLRLK